MLGKITGLMIILFVFTIGISQAQTNKRLVLKKKMVVTGLEKGDPNAEVVSYNTKSNLLPSKVFARDLTFNWNPTNLWSGYDLQSNSTPREIWVDTLNPMNVHSIFMWSSEVGPAVFSDRTIQYLISYDGGVTFLNTGQVPPSGNRSGYGAISGYSSDGTALVACHTFDATSATTRAIAFKDDGPGDGTFSTEWDPGVASNETTIWPRVTVIDDNNLAIAASGQVVTTSFYVNFYNTTNGWKGWEQLSGDQAETYDWAVSENGTVGLVYAGNSTNFGDVYYRQTTDFGVTWDSVQIWQTYLNQDSVDLGCLRSCQLTFIGNTPCATFEVGGVSATGLFADYPSSVYFWNPEKNGGIAISVADSSNVPFNTHWYYTNSSNQIESFLPICKPSIGRSSSGDALFITFVATTPYYYGDTTTTNVESYYAGWFTSSFDSGATWSSPLQFTQDVFNGHLQDYRYISLAPVSAVHDDSICTVQMAVQVDSIPGSQVQASGPPAFTPVISATQYIVNTDIVLPSLVTGVNERPQSVYSYSLQQNYPNPFNPTTKINYSLAQRSNVVLKVYNMLGQEVATLINSEQEVGSHSINFDASKLASGLYIYKLTAGNFTQSRKMMLLK